LVISAGLVRGPRAGGTEIDDLFRRPTLAEAVG